MDSSFATPRKRGRPRKNGVRPAWVLLRTCHVLFWYNRARAAGEKHSVAVKETVAKLRSLSQDMPISETEVKRVLSEFQGEDDPVVLQVTRLSEKEIHQNVTCYQELKIRQAETITSGFLMALGPRPQYRRHNAKIIAAL